MNPIDQTRGRRYTAKEAAEFAGIAYSTIRKHIAEGKLRAKRDGRCLWIEADELALLYPNFSEPPRERVSESADTADNSVMTAPNSAEETADTAHQSADTVLNSASHSTTTVLESDTEFRAEFTWIRQERDLLRQEVFFLRQQVLEQTQSTRALAEQNERLTLLLANEQARRIPALPKPLGWMRKVFGRRASG